MSATASPKIGGMKLGAEPKKVAILGGLVVVAIVLFVYNRLSDQTGETNVTTPPVPAAQSPALAHRQTAVRRVYTRPADQGTLKFKTVDPSNGDVDPTLRLDLLARLQSVQPLASNRNLFDAAPPPAPPMPIQKVIVRPGPLPPHPGTPGLPGSVQGLNVPLKFYGFARPLLNSPVRRGFFLDGDNVLVASEGDLLKNRYLVVELTPTSARLEDVQAKQRVNLPLVPEAQDAR